MRLPFDSAGIELLPLKEPYWGVEREVVHYDEMSQYSMWIDIGSYSIMLHLRFENRL